jgi:hypothetical protein
VARKWLSLAVGVVAFLGVVASPAVAAPVFIGSDLAAAVTANINVINPATIAQRTAPSSGAAAGGWTAPSSGVVVSWSVKSASTTTGQVRFRIVRSGLSTSATGAGTGSAHALTPGVSTFDDRLPIQTGDGIGLDIPVGEGLDLLSGIGGGDLNFWSSPVLIDGAPSRGGAAQAGLTLLLQAKIEPDADADGYGDESQDNCATTTNPDQADLDGDDIGDLCDNDEDGDTVLNVADNCDRVSNPLQEDTDGDFDGDACDSDDDNDGDADTADNCRTVVNADQRNTDADATGDACDADDDNDGRADAADNCRVTANAGQQDLDGDRTGDACDADDDGDGALDATDNCAAVSNGDQSNPDGDASGDACDADDDNDGLTDVAETALGSSSLDLDSDDDGLADAREDRNGDGRKGRRETGAMRFDTDRDGLGDGLERGLRRGVANPPGPIRGTGRKFRRDRNPRSKTNPLKRDTDRDGLRDGKEDRNKNGRVDKGETDPTKPGGKRRRR